MKKISLLVSMFVVGITLAFAQAQIAIGIKAGVNLATVDANVDNTENITAFHGGAFALFKLTKIGIQPEIIFSQQGSKFNFDGTDLESNFDYINIPVILKIYLLAGLNLQVGPQFGFLSKAELDGQDIKSSFKGSDTSLGIGVGWDLPLRFTIDARYNLGLSKIDDSPSFDNVKNRVIQVSLGYKLFKFGS